MVIAYKLESRLFDGAAYDTKTQTLALAFKGGPKYTYDVPPATFCTFMKAPSKGAFFNRNIRALPFTREE